MRSPGNDRRALRLGLLVKGGEPVEDTDEVCQVVPYGNRWSRVVGEHVLHRLNIVGELTHGGLRSFELEAERIPWTDCPVIVGAEINHSPLLPLDLVE